MTCADRVVLAIPPPEELMTEDATVVPFLDRLLMVSWKRFLIWTAVFLVLWESCDPLRS